MSAAEKQIGLAKIALQRNLIDHTTYNALMLANASYDLIEMLLDLISNPNETISQFIYRAAINS